MPSFKVTCPSCEAQVLIKNPKLVGTKVECPKCKYRFKVEAPAEAPAGGEKPADAAATATAPAATTDTTAVEKSPKKKPNKKKLLLGAGLGIVVIGLLVVGYNLAFADKKKTTQSQQPMPQRPPVTVTTGTVTGIVFLDANAEKVYNAEKHKGQPEVTVYVDLDGDGKKGENETLTKTDSEGKYTLADLPADQALKIRLENPEKKFEQTTEDPADVTLQAGITLPDINFGIKPTAKASGTPTSPETPMTPVVVASSKEAAALLPANSVAVCRLDVTRFLSVENALGAKLRDHPLTALFQDSLGFEPRNVKAYYHCIVGEKERAPFGILELKEPVAEKSITGAKLMRLGEGQAIKKWTVYPIASNPFIIAAGNTFAARSLLAELYAVVPPRPGTTPEQAMKDRNRQLGLCIYDSQTLMVGDLAVLKQFIEGLEANGYPKLPLTFAVGSTPPPYCSLPEPLRQLMVELTQIPGPGPAPGQPPVVAQPPVLLWAEQFNPAAYDPAQLKPLYRKTDAARLLTTVAMRAKYIGVRVGEFTQSRLNGAVVVKAPGPEALEITDALKDEKTGLPRAAPVLSVLLQSPFEFRLDGTPTGEASVPGGIPGFPGFPGFPPGMMPPGISPRPGGPPPGGSGGGPPPMGSAGGPPPIGSGGGPPPMGSGVGVPPGIPPGIEPPPGGTIPGITPPTQQTAKTSSFDLKPASQSVTMIVELYWTDQAYKKLFLPRLAAVTTDWKAKMAVHSGAFGAHALAVAPRSIIKQGRSFPPGTALGTETPDRVGPLQPHERVSFYPELLSYLGRGDVKKLLNNRHEWHAVPEKAGSGWDNLSVAAAWVPELLAPNFPEWSWRVTSPLTNANDPNRVLGGTNWVAVAGWGKNAARYNPADETQAKLVGITGYDWGSAIKDIADGPGKTIYLIQVRPGLARPWLSGGGATLIGLNEDPKRNPMDDLAHQRPDGEWGTYAIMADGTVRWIKKDIPANLLKALATRAGKEPISDDDLEKWAPLVPDPRDPVKPKTTPKTEVKEPAKTTPKTEVKEPAKTTPKTDAPKTQPKKADPKGEQPKAGATPPTEKK